MPHGSPGAGAGTGRAGGVGGANVGGGFSSRDVTQSRDGPTLRGPAGFRQSPRPRGVPGTNLGFFQNFMNAVAGRVGAFTNPVGGFLDNLFTQVFGPPGQTRPPGGVVDPRDIEGRDSTGDGRQRTALRGGPRILSLGQPPTTSASLAVPNAAKKQREAALRRKGRRSTILSGGAGVTGEAPLSQPQALGA